MRFSAAARAAASIRLIITGVASTRTRPEPMRGAVCSSPTTSSAWPSRPGFSFESSTTRASFPADLACRRAAGAFAGTRNAATQLDSIGSSQADRQGALMSSGELTRIDGRPISDNLQEIRAFLITWNDSLRLESALKHHRQLGVHRFFVADCGSTDGTLDRLSAAPDVHVFSATGDDSLVWLNTLLNTYGAGHWTLTLDTSEMFIYPHYEELELPLFCRYLNHVGARALPCLSLDMYAASPIADAVHRPGAPL